jgi:TolB protein
MNRRHALLSLPAFAAAPSLAPQAQAQQSDIMIMLTGGQQPTIALPELRGAGEAAAFMPFFNTTLFNEIYNARVIKIAPRSFYPRQIPQQPADFRQPPPGQSAGGLWLADWTAEPVGAGWLAIGYTAVQNNSLVLFGWLFDTTQSTIAGAQAFGKVYTGTLDEAGTRKVAQEFAADILARFGAKSLAGSLIYFISNRSGSKELWVMDYDGSNQRQLTRYNSIITTPAISPDNSKIAVTSFLRGSPGITVLSADSARQFTFANPDSSVVATPEFTPDGRQILFSTKIGSGYPNIFIANADGSRPTRITTARAVEVEPRVNPKNSNEVVFISGRSGTAQLYKMNVDGTNVERLTDGTGQVANPCWHPDGKIVAFSWTRGFEPGNFNIFIMDVASKKLVQLTHGAGRNQNPSWAPDGLHLAYGSRRGSNTQIWTMLADGTQMKPLTESGSNEMPVWSR